MIFGNTKGKNVTPLTLYNEPLEFVPQWTYLGVTIVAGSSLSFLCFKGALEFFADLSIHYYLLFKSQMNWY